MTIKALVLTGDGLNCERETARAIELAGGLPRIMHVNDLMADPKQLFDYRLLAIPGGFSFGDEINSGQLLALKLNYGLGTLFRDFVRGENLVIGICNGFQALVKLGLLPFPFEERKMTLSNNDHRTFLNRWVQVDAVGQRGPWTSLLPKSFKLPIRHGEGRIIFSDESVYQQLIQNGQIALAYTEDVNGSYQKIAGVTDPTGRILGLMPHPEAAVNKVLNPFGERKLEDDTGLLFFKSAINYLKERI